MSAETTKSREVLFFCLTEMMVFLTVDTSLEEVGAEDVLEFHLVTLCFQWKWPLSEFNIHSEELLYEQL